MTDHFAGAEDRGVGETDGRTKRAAVIIIQGSSNEAI